MFLLPVGSPPVGPDDLLHKTSRLSRGGLQSSDHSISLRSPSLLLISFSVCSEVGRQGFASGEEALDAACSGDRSLTSGEEF